MEIFGKDGMDSFESFLRKLPKMDVLLSSSAELLKRWAHEQVREALSSVLEDIRGRILKGEVQEVEVETVVKRAEEVLKRRGKPFVVSAINATGVILHTGLGRSVLPRSVVDSIYRVLCGYSVLEIDRESGKRCSRIERLSGMLCELFGVEAALAVNNDAAAVMLTLNTHACGKEVVVSRGELVEIGGSFRLPEIIAASGVKMVEVGTTNRTRIEDYEKAVSDSTKIFLKVHPSNYKIVGYTEGVPSNELAESAHRLGLLFLYDLGSGAVVDVGEPTVKYAVSSGADIVTFSGDKLFGGCQGGIILGKEAAVEPLRKNPLYRALRLDKIKIGLLERVVALYLDGRFDEFPILKMIGEPVSAAKRRAKRVLRYLPPGLPADFEIVESDAEIGGGSMAGVRVPSFALSVRPHSISEDDLSRRLRMYEPPVFVRTVRGSVLVDTKAVANKEVKTVASALTAALSEEQSD
ncbi:MAG: L-seryl-tRNA(Sec) selenium transferase [Planctomycetota bacterium]|nr:L-seryl-tRNA(Sec) selenium transferase [Planctomycetota bacterium]